MESTIIHKSISEGLTESEFMEVKGSVESMYQMMETIMQNM